MASKRMKRSEIANRIRRVNRDQVSRHRGDHTSTMFTVGDHQIVTVHSFDEVEVREAYEEGIVMLGSRVDQPVTMVTQLHEHDTSIAPEDCDCHTRFEPSVFRNALARTELGAARVAGV